VVKDMEDMEGDAKYGCKTMPLVWGVPVAKVFTAVWVVVLIGAIVILQFYVFQLGHTVSKLRKTGGIFLTHRAYKESHRIIGCLK
jgi:4-hydroxybenzoate polyprenyltransferase